MYSEEILRDKRRLVADFMAEPFDIQDYQIRYDENWDILMPVTKKIAGMGFYLRVGMEELKIGGQRLGWKPWESFTVRWSMEDLPYQKVMFYAVANFVEYYNDVKCMRQNPLDINNLPRFAKIGNTAVRLVRFDDEHFSDRPPAYYDNSPRKFYQCRILDGELVTCLTLHPRNHHPIVPISVEEWYESKKHSISTEKLQEIQRYYESF